MFKKSLITFLFLLFLISAGLAVDIHQLRSGVKIITQKLESDVIALDVWVRGGGRNETPETAGISHFIEHLIFKGSQKYKTGEMDRFIEEAGGIFNAATSKDYTHFYIVIPKQYFYRAVDVMGDALTNPSFPIEEIEKERKVIYEEIYRRNSNHEAVLGDLLFTRSFRSHPYRYRVLGYYSSLIEIERDDILKYFKRHYRGKNINVVAAGGLPKDAVAYLKYAFKNITALKHRIKEPEEEWLTERKLIEQKKNISSAYIYIGFSSPPASSFDSFIMDVLITALGNGRNSRLNNEIKEKKQLAQGIDVIYATPIDPSLVVIKIVCDKDDADKATNEVFKQLEIIKNNGLSEYELTKAKTIIRVDYKITHSSPESYASNLGYFAVVDKTDYEINYLKNIDLVKNADIKRVVDKYFNLYTIVRYLPK